MHSPSATCPCEECKTKRWLAWSRVPPRPRKVWFRIDNLTEWLNAGAETPDG